MADGAQESEARARRLEELRAAADPKTLAYIDAYVEDALGERLKALDQRIEELAEGQLSDRATIVVFSGDFDRLMAAFIIATGAVAMGFEVSMYFTFWGLTALKKETRYKGKGILEKMVSVNLPGGPDSVGTSKMNMMGMGPLFFKALMKKNHVETLPDMIDLAREMEVRMVACQMSMGVMGIEKEELIDGIDYGGVATYLGDGTDSKITLFI
ncbi:MAG: DsrE/DsrF/DrsH-like family protein [Myxococcales bacterium]|nr:DsrE/DsrF/DrsH-like family protein [Myxococcales bacterium]